MRIVFWQMATSLAIFALAILASTFGGFELPNSLGVIGVLLGAQAYSSNVSVKNPDALVGMVGSVAFKAGAVTALLQLAFGASLIVAAAKADPEMQKVVDWMTSGPWQIPVIVAVALIATLALTRFGVMAGMRAATRARRRLGSSADRKTPAPQL